MEDLQSCESSFVLRYLRLFAVKGIKTLLIINFSLLPATSGYPEATLVILCVSAASESCGNRNPATVMQEKFLSPSQRKFVPVQTIGLGGSYNKAITQRNTTPLENKIRVATYRIEKGKRL